MPRPFRLTAPERPELAIHEECARILDRFLKPPAVWAAYPAGHVHLAPAEVARLKRIGLKPGWPDLLIFYEGLVFGCEIKARGGKLSQTRIGRTRRGSPRIYEGQAEVFPRLEKAGMAIAIVHSGDELVARLRRWGLPLRIAVAA